MCKSNKDAQGLAEDVEWYSRSKQANKSRIWGGSKQWYLVILTDMNVSDYDFECIIWNYCIIW